VAIDICALADAPKLALGDKPGSHDEKRRLNEAASEHEFLGKLFPRHALK
jgi:hypothetical protein